MEEQEKTGGEAQNGSTEPPEATATPPQPAAEATTTPPAEQAPGEGGGAPPAAAPAAKAERPAKEAKPPAKQPAPPGSIADVIKEALPDLQLEAFQSFSNVIVEVSRDDIAKAMPVLRDDPRLDLKFLRVLFGVDHLDEGMEVLYQLISIEKKHEVTVKTRLPKDDLRLASVVDVWHAADWHERETRDMFGIEFVGHPHLVPLLLPEDMTDHYPLRKDNALQELQEWQGERLGANMSEAGYIPPGSGYDDVGGDKGGEA